MNPSKMYKGLMNSNLHENFKDRDGIPYRAALADTEMCSKPLNPKMASAKKSFPTTRETKVLH